MIPEVLSDDETPLFLSRVERDAATLSIELEQPEDGWRWRITCNQVFDWRISGDSAKGLVFAKDDDPILWFAQYSIHATYFIGRPADPFRAACEVLSLVPQDVQLFVTPNRLASLLDSGNGCIGHLPLPAIQRCTTALRNHGVNVYAVGPDESEANSVLHALRFGSNSFVIATEFRFERIDAKGRSQA